MAVKTSDLRLFCDGYLDVEIRCLREWRPQSARYGKLVDQS